MIGFEKKGYLKSFATLDECEKYLGRKPVLSRFGCIKRVKNGRTKRRIILDLKQSHVTKCTKKSHCALLPKMIDLIADALDMAVECSDQELVEFPILDFIDAFWLVPLNRRERKYFAGKARGCYYIFLCTPQGSRGAPYSHGGVSWCTCKKT